MKPFPQEDSVFFSHKTMLYVGAHHDHFHHSGSDNGYQGEQPEQKAFPFQVQVWYQEQVVGINHRNEDKAGEVFLVEGSECGGTKLAVSPEKDEEEHTECRMAGNIPK